KECEEVQPTASIVRRTNSYLDSYRKVLSDQVQESQDYPPLQQHLHHHEEGDVCACEHFTSNYNRLRSRFSQFEGLPPKCALLIFLQLCLLSTCCTCFFATRFQFTSIPLI